MNIDARTLVGIMRKAPGHEQTIEALADDHHPCICATAVAEAAILLGAAKDPTVSLRLDIAMRHLKLSVIPFTDGDVRAAVDEYRRMTSTGGHRLTLAHCLSGAIAVRTGSKMFEV